MGGNGKYESETYWRHRASGRRNFGNWESGRQTPKKRREFCSCAYEGCTNWRYADLITEQDLRCLCRRVFAKDYLPARLHAQRDALEKADLAAGKKHEDYLDKPPKHTSTSHDQDARETAQPLNQKELEDLKKQLGEEEAMAESLVQKFGVEVPEKVATSIAELKDRIANFTELPPELDKDDDARQAAELRKKLRKASTLLEQKKKHIQKQKDEEKMLETKLQDFKVLIRTTAEEIEEAENQYVEITRELHAHSLRNKPDQEAQMLVDEAGNEDEDEDIHKLQSQANTEYQNALQAQFQEMSQKFMQQFMEHVKGTEGGGAAAQAADKQRSFSFKNETSKEVSESIAKAQQRLEEATAKARSHKAAGLTKGTRFNKNAAAVAKAQAELQAAKDAVKNTTVPGS